MLLTSLLALLLAAIPAHAQSNPDLWATLEYVVEASE
jgi:hypothetical protein